MFLETMERVLADTDKVIVDEKAGSGVVPYLPLSEFTKRAPGPGRGEPAMNRTALTAILIILGIAAVVAYLTLFTVYQTQQALVLEFGKPKREIKDPGLHYKIPFIQNVEYFDKRILDIDTASQEVIASDKKRLVVDAFARYRITDPCCSSRACATSASPIRGSAPFSKPRSGACSAARPSRRWCATSARR